ncbi:MAG: sigma-70 family RNA polymerase sigma factor [Acidobacteriota bacterium]
MEDEKLLQAIIDDEPGAFDEFVRRYGRRLMAFSVRTCSNVDNAEDVFQDTLLKAYQALADLREPKALRTWLYRVAANNCRMMRRKDKAPRKISLDDYKPPGWEDGDLIEVADWSELPDDAAGRAELRDAFEEGLRELPADYRMVLLMRDVEGLSTKETADALEIGESAVKMRLHRARMALREHLAEYQRHLNEDAGVPA